MRSAWPWPAHPDLELVAAVDPGYEGQRIEGLTVAGDVAALRQQGAEVVVDFSVAEAVRANLPVYAREGIHAVVGTTGLGDAELGRRPGSSPSRPPTRWWPRTSPSVRYSSCASASWPHRTWTASR